MTREIARGGMGRIQIARDRRLGREVAIKEILADRGTARRRFEREARITAKLQHPSIIGVHEAGLWPSGEPFYAMPFLNGRSLEEAIEQSRTLEQRLALVSNVIAIADAMAYAHDRRVIHRDLKPRNVIVGEFGETVVIDWGLAKELDVTDSLTSLPPELRSADEHLSSGGGDTTIGDVIGTPAYMPPEQAAGQVVDERADVYAIGAILYHVLADTAPFAGTSKTELLSNVLAHGPRSITELAREVPRELVAIVDRAMARDLDVRYRTARELADDLRRFQTGQLVGAHRYSTRQLIRRWIGRHRTAIAAVGAATIVAIAIGIFALTRILAAQRVAEEQRALALANQASAEDLLRFMMVDLREKLGKLGRLELLDTVARRAATHYDTRGAATSDEDLYLAALARDGIGAVLEKRGDLPGAATELAKAHTAFVTLAARHPANATYRAKLTLSQLSLARIQAAQGDSKGALENTRSALAEIARHRAAHGGDAELLRVVYEAHRQIASLLDELGDPDASLAEYQLTLKLAEEGAAAKDADLTARRRVLSAHSSIGRLLRKAKHDYPKALESYRKGLEIGKQLAAAEPDNPGRVSDVGISQLQIGHVLFEMKEYDAALVDLRAAEATFRRLIAIDPTNADWKDSLWGVHEKIGMVLFAKQDYTGALAEYRSAHALTQESVARDPTNTDQLRGLTIILNKIGDVQLANKDGRGALASYQQALGVREQLVAKDPANANWRRDRFYSHIKIAGAYITIPEEQTKARTAMEKALALAEENLRLHPKNTLFQFDVVGSFEGIGDAEVELKNPDAARRAYTVALDRARDLAGPTRSKDWEELIKSIEAKLAKL